jgi:competence protein ComEC
MKRPLVAVVSCYAMGLLLAEISQPPPAALFISAFATLAPALILPRFRPFLIWPLLALAGWTNLIIHTAVISPNDLRVLLGKNAVLATVRGTLAETPHLKIAERDNQQTEHTLAQVRVTELRNGENWQPALGSIMVATPGTLPSNFFTGQPVEISGVIAPPPAPLAEGLFDYRDYLQTRGIFYELKTGSTNDWNLLKPHFSEPPLADRFLDWSKRTLAYGLPAEDESLHLLWAMTLGWRTAFTGDISEPFLRAGTMHLFAIDGLRIALISGMLVALLRVVQVSRAWCGLIAVPLIWFYTDATGWESSAIRASVMMTIVLGGWALKRPSDLINSLAAAAFVILLWEPRQLFEASFQLSFFVVLVIGLLLPPLNKISDRLLQQDSLLPNALLPRWRRGLVSILRLLARYCALSFAAWIGSIPLSAKYFHLFSPISTPANIIAVPLGTLALMSNLGALVCGTWFSQATVLFNNSAWFFMSAMTKVSVLATEIPGAYFYVPEPSWRTIAIYYAVIVGALSGRPFAPKRRIWSVAILTLIGAIYFWHREQFCKETELTILPLNGGHAVFVDAAGQKNDWLVDCGNENAVTFTLKQFLHAQGVNKIPRLALTEGDSRNSGGAQSLNELFGVGEIYTSPIHFRSSAYRDAVSRFDQSPARHKIVQRGDQTGCWQVLHPDANDNFPHADDNALVLLGNFHGTKILLLSDLGREGQNALLAHTNDLRADIVIAGLPEAGEPLCDALFRAIQPKIIVIADSEFPASRRANPKLRERLEQKEVPVIYTCASGAVTIRVRPNGWELRAMDGEKFSPTFSPN